MPLDHDPNETPEFSAEWFTQLRTDLAYRFTQERLIGPDSDASRRLEANFAQQGDPELMNFTFTLNAPALIPEQLQRMFVIFAEETSFIIKQVMLTPEGMNCILHRDEERMAIVAKHATSTSTPLISLTIGHK